MKESAIEAYLVSRIRRIGGVCFKFVSPGMVGVPDRIVILPSGELVWVELKRPNGVVSSIQKRMHARLRALMQDVKVVRSIEEIDKLFWIER